MAGARGPPWARAMPILTLHGAAPAAPGLSQHEEPPRESDTLSAHSRARPRAMAGRPCRKGPRRAGPGWAVAPRSPPRCCRCSAALGRPPSPPRPRPRPAPHGRAAAAAASAPAAPTACETPVSAALAQPPCPPCRCPAIAAQLRVGKGHPALPGFVLGGSIRKRRGFK